MLVVCVPSCRYGNCFHSSFCAGFGCFQLSFQYQVPCVQISSLVLSLSYRSFHKLFRRCSARHAVVFLGIFFLPPWFLACCSHLHLPDFRSHNLFPCLFSVPLISGLMLDSVCIFVWQRLSWSQRSAKDHPAAVERNLLKCSIHQNRTYFWLFFFFGKPAKNIQRNTGPFLARLVED